MIRIVLVPVDGSAGSDRAVQSLIENRTGPQPVEKMEIHLLNVQHPLWGDVSTFVDHDEIPIGTRGHAALANLLGDAVASTVMSRADVPVKVVK
jgi:hypothetical protein